MNEINSIYHLADRPDLYEPSTTNAFQFIVKDLDKLLPAGLSEDLAEQDDYLTGAQDIIKVSVISASVPHFTIDPISIRRGNSVMKFAGTPSFEAGSLKLHDYVGVRTKDILMAWQAQAYDVNNDVVKLASNYKHDCVLIEYNQDLTKELRSWTLKGCWISGITEEEFNYENADRRTLSATIQYDRAIPVIPSVE